MLNVLQVPLNIMDTGLFATSGLEYNVDQSVIHAIVSTSLIARQIKNRVKGFRGPSQTL